MTDRNASFSYDIPTLDPDDAYKLLVGAVQPRPIAWVSTISAEGDRNLAPFSFFTVASRQPPMLFLSIGPSDRPCSPRKDTLANIEAVGEFVVNVVSENLLEAMKQSSRAEAAEVDEFEIAGLETVPSVAVRPPRVLAARISMECRLEKLEKLGTDTGVIGRVLWLHAHPGIVVERFRVDTQALQPVGRMAGPNYCTGLHPHPSLYAEPDTHLCEQVANR